MKLLENFKNHIIVILLFIGISFTYFSPLLEGKRLEMADIKNWQGMSKEVVDYRKSTGEEALWTNSMFSGMPAYQISTRFKSNLMQYLDKTLMLGLPRPANILFLYLLGFYILLLSLKIDYRISTIGAFAFAFSSYFFIIIEAGHMTKAHAIAYLPMVVAGVLYTYRGKILLGSVLTGIAASLQIFSNHLQITYYLVLLLFLLAIFQFYSDLKKNNLSDFFKRSSLLILIGLLAAGTSFTRLYTTYEYGKDSTRGKSELTSNLDNKTSGLDKDYATAWSYGIAETFTFLIPNLYGGASQGELSTDSETYQAIKRAPNARKLIKSLPLYWGEQPFTSGPTYVGAVVMFLFILSIFLVKSTIRSWLLLATIMSIMLAWGKNFMPLTELFLDFFPGYNKFRAVSMILIIAEFTIPLLAFIGISKFIQNDTEIYSKEKYLKNTFYISGGVTLVFALMSSLFFNFESIQDISLEKNGWPIEALQADRKSLLSSDAWRSLIFIFLTFVTLWIYIRKKIKLNHLILILGSLILMDMWPVNKRYLNEENFVRKSKIENPYKPSQADLKILKDKDPNFRVFNRNVSTFNDASTSYFHKSIGGYHGAKLKRYQELIEAHISQGNMNVINMLNTKYIITQNGDVKRNPGALGNAWFIDNVIIVENADQELMELNNINTTNTCVVDKRYSNELNANNLNKENSNINLLEYKPNYLKYQSSSDLNGIAIFSEIYYNRGWNAYINGNLVNHFRTNYVLRGLQIPSGNNIIEFKFEPSVYQIGESISLISSILLLILFSFVSYNEFKS